MLNRKNENIGYKFAISIISRIPSRVLYHKCFISLNKEKNRLFFYVLVVRLSYSDPEPLHFF